MDTQAQDQSKIRFGTFELDPASGELRKGGVKVRLQEQPFLVLKVLIEQPGQIVGREELRQLLWPDDTFVDFEDGLSTAVKKVRQALGDSAPNPRFIETLPKRDYRFIASVEAAEKSPEARPALNGGFAETSQAAARSRRKRLSLVALSRRRPPPPSYSPSGSVKKAELKVRL